MTVTYQRKVISGSNFDRILKDFLSKCLQTFVKIRLKTKKLCPNKIKRHLYLLTEVYVRVNESKTVIYQNF